MIQSDHDTKISWRYSHQYNSNTPLTKKIDDFREYTEKMIKDLEEHKPGDLDQTDFAKMWNKFYRALGVVNRDIIEITKNYTPYPLNTTEKLLKGIEDLQKRLDKLERNAKYDDMRDRKHM